MSGPPPQQDGRAAYVGGAGIMGVGGAPLPSAASRASKKRAAVAEAAGASAAASRNVRPESAATLQIAASMGFSLPPLAPSRGSAAPPAAPLAVLADEEEAGGGSAIEALLAQVPRHWNILQFEAPQTAVRLCVLCSC